MKTCGLFAGIGGLEMGLQAAGHESVLLCELWEPARAVLTARMPGVTLAGDIVDLRSIPGETEIVAAGFPCQDLSQAGRTLGIDGSKSGLVSHVFRLLDEVAAPWVVLENVSFMLNLDRGRALTTIVEAFEARAYRWAYRVINSLGFLPQRRERVFVLATRTECDPADVLLADEMTSPTTSTELTSHAHGFYWTEGTRGLGWAPNAIPTLKNGSTIGIPSPPAILLPTGEVITPDIRDAERLQGFPEDWTLPSTSVGRSSLRWSLLGNAVTVPVAEWVGRRLSTPGRYESSRDRPLTRNGRWPKAARFDGSTRHAVEISSHAEWRSRADLHDFLKYPGKLLSARATRGFLGRADASTLRFVDGFKPRLRQHLSKMETIEKGKAAVARPEMQFTSV